MCGLKSLLEKLSPYIHKVPLTRAEDGRWVIFTLGEFVRLLIDAGDDPVVAVRVYGDYDIGLESSWIRAYEIAQIPQGGILNFIGSTELALNQDTLIQPEIEKLFDAGQLK